MEIIINEKNISEETINERKEKVRAIIITKDNKILVANYGGVLLLPGGKVDFNESLDEAILRELNEEIGIDYTNEEVKQLLSLIFYQENYSTRDGYFCNRKITTYYYLAPYKGIIETKQKLTESEKKGDFNLELLSLDELKNRLIKINLNNPRSIFFMRELNTVISEYLSITKNINCNNQKQDNHKVLTKKN